MYNPDANIPTPKCNLEGEDRLHESNQEKTILARALRNLPEIMASFVAYKSPNAHTLSDYDLERLVTAVREVQEVLGEPVPNDSDLKDGILVWLNQQEQGAGMIMRADSTPTDEQKDQVEYFDRFLGDIWQVGPEKPLGYLPMSMVNSYKPTLNPDYLIEKLRERGLKLVLIPVGNSNTFLYVYDQEALSNLLTQNKHILSEANWPSTPLEFVQKVSGKAVPQGPLFDLIADAFADYTNTGRS